MVGLETTKFKSELSIEMPSSHLYLRGSDNKTISDIYYLVPSLLMLFYY